MTEFRKHLLIVSLTAIVVLTIILILGGPVWPTN